MVWVRSPLTELGYQCQDLAGCPGPHERVGVGVVPGDINFVIGASDRRVSVSATRDSISRQINALVFLASETDYGLALTERPDEVRNMPAPCSKYLLARFDERSFDAGYQLKRLPKSCELLKVKRLVHKRYEIPIRKLFIFQNLFPLYSRRGVTVSLALLLQ